MNTWLWVIILAVLVVGYWVASKDKLKINLRSLFTPRMTITQLRKLTEQEVAKAKELQDALEAKKELARAKAKNARLWKEINAVNEKSVEQDKDSEQSKEQEATKAKLRRL